MSGSANNGSYYGNPRHTVGTSSGVEPAWLGRLALLGTRAEAAVGIAAMVLGFIFWWPWWA